MMTDNTVSTSVAEGRRKIQVVEEFMKAIEQVGGEVPPGLRSAVNVYLAAVNKGLDAAEAADEVSKELSAIYRDMHAICRVEAGILPGQPHSFQQDDVYDICLVRVDHPWVARNRQKVLNWNDDGSWVRKLWDKWRPRIRLQLSQLESLRQRR
jgi:hypothetical protein